MIRRHAAWLLVTAVGLWVLWPAPAGHMPLSADHTVHLTRTVLTATQLSAGRLSGWTPTWFFGTPVGDLYPQFADLLVICVRMLSVGLLNWSQAYAVGFSLAFVGQGWVMLAVGNSLDRGRLPGLVAACLVLLDPGYAREGGWMYTVWFGVWPQALATSLCWLGFARLHAVTRSVEEGEHATDVVQNAMWAAVCLAAALLAHPMVLAMLGLGVPLFLVCVLPRHRSSSGLLMAWVALVMTLAVAMAAWWWVPMLAHRGWMASYGWLYASLHHMTELALRGEWTHRMPPAAGYLAAAGLAWLAVAGSGWQRFVGAFALVQWLWASSDVFWQLRLHRLSEGFTHLQYQRFLIAAKPGFFLTAGLMIALLVHTARRFLRPRNRVGLLPQSNRTGSAVGVACFLLAASAAAWLASDTRRAVVEYGVGELQTVRRTQVDTFETDYREFLEWSRQEWLHRDEDYRMAFSAGRNAHWFMDAPVYTNTPSYKLGFTPGDNFVHKPESGEDDLLDRLRVRYFVSLRRKRSHRSLRQVARFGKIRVYERAGDLLPIASLTGPGTLRLVTDTVDEGIVRVEVSGSATSRIVFHVSGYPRWELRLDGEPLEWFELSASGEPHIATQSERRAGKLRGGKAEGDDGSTPMLIAADLPHDGALELRYRYRLWFDWLASLISIVSFSLALLTLHIGRKPQMPRILRTLRTLRMYPPRLFSLSTGLATRIHAATEVVGASLRPRRVVFAALLVASGTALRWYEAAESERNSAVGWLDEKRVDDRRSIYAGPLKTNMLIRPACRVKRKRRQQATVVFPDVQIGSQLGGWFALHDDDAQSPRRGGHTLRIALRKTGDMAQTIVFDQRIRHQPGMVKLDIDCLDACNQSADVLVYVDSEGESPPRMGFDLDLSPAAAEER
ncbi:MAG: 6-pyruvoyl-tetrahydropterin synthase-related protein [Nannocystaceae bacterium]